jgi:hypothetical protein
MGWEMVTTIQVQESTRDLLKSIGEKGKTYDQIVHELVEIREAFIDDLLKTLKEGEFIPLEGAIREVERRKKGLR